MEITQEELSERIGITSEALGRIERGSAMPSFPTFMRLCPALGATPDALLSENEAEQDIPQAPVNAEPKGFRLLVRTLRRLDSRQQRVVLGFARELLRSAHRPRRSNGAAGKTKR
jgi:transcriptional regulator with XRE-family HTH domain